VKSLLLALFFSAHPRVLQLDSKQIWRMGVSFLCEWLYCWQLIQSANTSSLVPKTKDTTW